MCIPLYPPPDREPDIDNKQAKSKQEKKISAHISNPDKSTTGIPAPQLTPNPLSLLHRIPFIPRSLPPRRWLLPSTCGVSRNRTRINLPQPLLLHHQQLVNVLHVP